MPRCRNLIATVLLLGLALLALPAAVHAQPYDYRHSRHHYRHHRPPHRFYRHHRYDRRS